MEPVLCINDNEINLFVQKRLLLQSGVTNNVLTFTDGQQALDYYSSLKETNTSDYPKLILLDIHMPVVDGWEFLDKFTELYLPAFPDTNVVINSYTVDSEEMEKAKKYPVIIDFLSSSLTVEYLQNLPLNTARS